jgi:hypothetical protein
MFKFFPNSWGGACSRGIQKLDHRDSGSITGGIRAPDLTAMRKIAIGSFSRLQDFSGSNNFAFEAAALIQTALASGACRPLSGVVVGFTGYLGFRA